MKKLMMVAVVAACAAEAVAMPTKAELTKAQPLVAELMAPEMAKYKAAGYKEKAAAAVKVGDSSSEFAKAAETEAAKFLLLKGAVNFYTRGEQYDKAAESVVTLQREVKDVPPAVIAEITGKATGKISEAKAPKLYALYRSAKLQVRAADEAKALAAKLKKAKSDALQRKYAEALAVSGDWKAAYAEFAKVSDAKLKEIAAAEAAGNAKSAESGEFWWAYQPAFEDAEDFFKSHAAAYYRKALDAGEITGLKKTIVEQRIAGIAAEAAPAVSMSSTQEQKRIELPIVGAAPIVLIRCPAGKFTMGYDLKPTAFFKHEVEITRPFWMSEAPITVGQYCALMGVFEELYKPRLGVNPADGMRKLAEAMGGDDSAVSGVTVSEVDAYCEKLAGQCGKQMPKGYVVRLPSEAEWMYAFTCGGHVKEPNYAALARGNMAADYSKVGVDIHKMMPDILKKQGITFANNAIWRIVCDVPCYRVKTRKSNDWGFYDLVGLCWERLADRVSSSYAGSATWNKKGDKCFSDLNERLAECGEVDPILTTDEEPGQTLCVKCRPDKWGKWVNESMRLWDVGFRLVVGPDLVSEQKAKHGKK